MQILKYILVVIYIINTLALIAITMMQHKDDQGLSGTITGAAANNFLDKNKGRTKEGRLKKWTIVLGISFVIITVILGTIYML